MEKTVLNIFELHKLPSPIVFKVYSIKSSVMHVLGLEIHTGVNRERMAICVILCLDVSTVPHYYWLIQIVDCVTSWTRSMALCY